MGVIDFAWREFYRLVLKGQLVKAGLTGTQADELIQKALNGEQQAIDRIAGLGLTPPKPKDPED